MTPVFYVIQVVFMSDSMHNINIDRINNFLKFRYIIVVDPNGAGFLISNTDFVAGWKHCPTSEKYIEHKRNPM